LASSGEPLWSPFLRLEPLSVLHHARPQAFQDQANDPVIAEINTRPVLYGWGNRISIYTGLPAIAGWDWHLRQQMAALPVERIARRIDLVNEIYNSPDSRHAWELLRRYHTEWVVVGELERACATKEGIAKFPAGQGKCWHLAFQQPGISIYHVRAAE